MTILCAVSQSPFAAHHSACTGGGRPAGGAAFETEAFKAAGVIAASSPTPRCHPGRRASRADPGPMYHRARYAGWVPALAALGRDDSGAWVGRESPPLLRREMSGRLLYSL